MSLATSAVPPNTSSQELQGGGTLTADTKNEPETDKIT